MVSDGSRATSMELRKASRPLVLVVSNTGARGAGFEQGADYVIMQLLSQRFSLAISSASPLPAACTINFILGTRTNWQSSSTWPGFPMSFGELRTRIGQLSASGKVNAGCSILLPIAIEWTWNTFPSTTESSLVLLFSHLVLLAGLYASKADDALADEVRRDEADVDKELASRYARKTRLGGKDEG